MDNKLANYRTLLKRIFTDYANLYRRANELGVHSYTVFDEERDHYLLHTIGWADREHVWNTTLYVRIENGKFYIEIDWTEEGIVTELLAAGVPKEDIVLAFHHPSIRPHTEFAVA
ncbi:MAG: XisI protein [Caldilineaceae bacterium]